MVHSETALTCQRQQCRVLPPKHHDVSRPRRGQIPPRTITGNTQRHLCSIGLNKKDPNELIAVRNQELITSKKRFQPLCSGKKCNMECSSVQVRALTSFYSFQLERLTTRNIGTRHDPSKTDPHLHLWSGQAPRLLNFHDSACRNSVR